MVVFLTTVSYGVTFETDFRGEVFFQNGTDIASQKSFSPGINNIDFSDTNFNFYLVQKNRVYIPFYALSNSDKVGFKVEAMPYYNDFSMDLNGIDLSFPRRDLSSDLCSVSVSATNRISSNLNSPYQASGSTYSIPDSILKDYYYMKTFVALEVTDNDGNIIGYVYPDSDSTQGEYEVAGRVLEENGIDTSQLDNQELDEDSSLTSSDTEVPYVLAKPDDVSVSFVSNLANFVDRGFGDYNFEMIAIPIDMKCDFDSSGDLDSSEILSDNNNLGTTQDTVENFGEDFDSFVQSVIHDKPVSEIDQDEDGVIDAFEKSTCRGEENGKIFFGGCSKPQFIGDSFTLPPHSIYDKFRNLEINRSAKIVELLDDTKTTNKLIYNYSNHHYYFENSKGKLEQLDDFKPFKKKIEEKSGTTVSETDLLSPDMYTLDAFKIRPFSNKEDIEGFLNKSSETMRSLDINKTKSINDGKQEVSYSIGNISGENPLTMYVIFDKSITIDQIVPKDSTGKFFIQEKDPIIGWHFDEDDDSSDEEVGYEVPEDEDDGTIVITEEPILYNEGELIVNYRNTECNPDEQELFQLDELENSSVYHDGSHNFKVCLAHVNETVEDLTTYNNSIELGGVTDDNYITQESSGTLVGASIDKSKNENFVWDMKIQKDNPDGNYSCVGSYGVGDPSTFGDCGYNPDNRLWVHFGKDIMSPNTTIDVPVLSHTVYIDFSIEEEPVYGAGLNKTMYCITGEYGSCDPQYGESQTLNGNSDEFRIQESCPDDSGCRKKIRYQSVDNFGNKEDIKEYDLNIIDKASSCQSNCLSVPSPDRYLKECRGINQCEYYETNGDDGEKVAQLCDLQLEDTWVSYNTTHEIQCPGGPIRETSFTGTNLDINSRECSQLRTTPYSIIFNGQSMIMNIVSCIR